MKGKTIAVVVLYVVLAAFGIFAIVRSTKKVAYADGTWSGTGNGRNGPIDVSLVIEDGRIMSASLVSMQESEYALPAVNEILRQVVQNNSADSYDAVSGATITSKGTIQAARDALSKAKLSN